MDATARAKSLEQEPEASYEPQQRCRLPRIYGILHWFSWSPASGKGIRPHMECQHHRWKVSALHHYVSPSSPILTGFCLIAPGRQQVTTEFLRSCHPHERHKLNFWFCSSAEASPRFGRHLEWFTGHTIFLYLDLFLSGFLYIGDMKFSKYASELKKERERKREDNRNGFYSVVLFCWVILILPGIYLLI